MLQKSNDTKASSRFNCSRQVSLQLGLRFWVSLAHVPGTQVFDGSEWKRGKPRSSWYYVATIRLTLCLRKIWGLLKLQDFLNCGVDNLRYKQPSLLQSKRLQMVAPGDLLRKAFLAIKRGKLIMHESSFGLSRAVSYSCLGPSLSVTDHLMSNSEALDTSLGSIERFRFSLYTLVRHSASLTRTWLLLLR